MPDVWIGFNCRDRQRYWWRTGFLTLALAGVMPAMGLTTQEPGTWWWVGGMGAVSVLVVLSTINAIYGRVLLTPRGLEFRTFVTRRVVLWSEVAGIEKRQRVSRSGTWWDLRVVRVHGRAVNSSVTGAKAPSRNGLDPLTPLFTPTGAACAAVVQRFGPRPHPTMPPAAAPAAPLRTFLRV
ncbi:hypothetical protein [Streptomyces sp. NPDC057403]|uniref:hypothetical protein n=1 Tax=Streptomyces sp. NPDC057403 TaxID=3346119 RepID=UPI0036B8A0E5